MDKLKPLLTHKFWILFAAALLVPLIGWWMGTGAIATPTDARWKKLEEAKAPDTATSPNQTWVEGAQGVVAVKQQLLRASGEELWELQDSLRTWPRSVARDVAGVPPGGDIPNRARELYRRQYFWDLNRVLAKADPIVPPEGYEKRSKRLVAITQDNVPHPDADEFNNRTPSSREIWEAQEDLWLLESLINAIAAVNEGANHAQEAPVLSVERISFHGGSRAAAGAGEGATATATAAPGGAHGGGGSSSGYGAMLGQQRGGRRQGAQGSNIEPNPQDVFGPDTLAAAGGTSGATTSGGHSAMSSAMSGGTGKEEARRYVDDDPAAPFKTRGFILRVVMDHTRVPQLLSELARVQWPVQVLVVNQQAVNESLMSGAGTGGGGTGNYRPSRGGGHGGTSSRGMSGSSPRGMMQLPMSGGGGHSSAGRPGRFPTGGVPMGPGGHGGRGGGLPRPGATGTTRTSDDPALDEALSRHEEGLKDPSTATVVIAGLMTIYQPSQLSVGGAIGQSATTPSGQSGSTPPGQQAAPADPSQPAAGQAPAGNEPQPGAETAPDGSLPPTSPEVPGTLDDPSSVQPPAADAPAAETPPAPDGDVPPAAPAGTDEPPAGPGPQPPQ